MKKIYSSRWFFMEDKKKSELLKSIDGLESCFSDPEERHVKYFRFREELKEMRNAIDPKYWDLSRLILGCIDATTNTEAEDLTRSQIEAFRRVIEELSENIGCSEANSLLGILISADLKPIPDLKNLESIEI
jgi:hypothetical protein